jgi:hypothetical protein
MLFSQRKGFKPFSNEIQYESISEDLRNSLWNVLDIYIWREKFHVDSRFTTFSSELDRFSIIIWINFFKKPIDTRPTTDDRIVNEIRKYFFNCKWFEVFDFLQFILRIVPEQELIERVNSVLETELSAYRFVGNVFTDITNEQELEMMNEALRNTDFPGVSEHLKRALELLSDRKNPDYRNSIKESISAVESICQSITGKPKATLGDALKELRGKKKFHAALLEAFSKLYGYTSDEGGIRHAMMDEPDLGSSDAIFFLMSCTSFINYLKSKL